MKKYCIIKALFFLCIQLCPVYAQTAAGNNNLIFDLDPDWIGLVITLGYRGLSFFPDVDTVLKASLAGNYHCFAFYHTPDGKPYDGSQPGYDPEQSPVYQRASALFSLELAQGLLWNEREMHNLLELFVGYRFRYYNNIKDQTANQLIFSSQLPDKSEQLQNSLMVGMEWRDLNTTNPHRIFFGTSMELSLEYGPEWLLNSSVGKADYCRFNTSAKAFLPLFDVNPNADLNIFSAYLGIFLAFDYAWGGYIPLSIRETVGGKYPRKGLGYAVRGLEDCRFDAPLKIVANVELRFNLPALGSKEILPGILIFLDSGYYDFINFESSGFLFSTGGGIFLSLFETVDMTFTTQLLLNEKKVNGEVWTPFTYAFMFHF
jgi:hypothetical protein